MKGIVDLPVPDNFVLASIIANMRSSSLRVS